MFNLKKNKSISILSPTAILGYGFPDESLAEGVKHKPDLIAVDAGSIDPGPYYLGSGKSFTPRHTVKFDLKRLIMAQKELGVKLIIGSAGGAGARPHLDWTLDIINEISSEIKVPLRICEIAADISHELVSSKLNDNKLTPLSKAPPITKQNIQQIPYIVAQMGHEPIISVLDEEFDIILCGRCYDPAIFSALPIMKDYDPALAIHLGKILECAAIAASPGSGSDCIIGHIFENYFILESLNNVRKFTPNSVAAHTLYEKSDPYHLPGPGGILHTKNVQYTQLSDGRVKVSGGCFETVVPYTVKLEGVRSIGFRSISVAGIRDPRMILNLSEILEEVKIYCQPVLNKETQLVFHAYGKNGVMGKNEPMQQTPIEIGLVIEVVSTDQESANNDCAFVRSTLLHFGYKNRLSSAGNLAFPFSPSDLQGGEVFEFCLHHLMEIDDPLQLFKLAHKEFGT